MVHSPILSMKRLSPRGFQFCLSVGKSFAFVKCEWAGGCEGARGDLQLVSWLEARLAPVRLPGLNLVSSGRCPGPRKGRAHPNLSAGPGAKLESLFQ